MNPKILAMRMGLAVILKLTPIWRCPVVLLCVCVMFLYADRAFCAAKFRTIHGSWTISLDTTQKKDLKVYFGGNDEQDIFTKASSAIFTFDIKKMRFIRNVLEKETIHRIKNIEKHQNLSPDAFILWLEQVKFPDYIVVLPDGRLRYGSTWAYPWEFILQRK